MGFRDPDEEVSEPAIEARQGSLEKLDTPAKRQYREKGRPSDENADVGRSHARESDRNDRRDARQDRERSPRRDRCVLYSALVLFR